MEKQEAATKANISSEPKLNWAKRNTFVVVGVLVFALIVVVLAVFASPDFRRALNLDGPSFEEQLAQFRQNGLVVCDYQQNIYIDQQEFSAGDACNKCTCSGGNVQCSNDDCSTGTPKAIQSCDYNGVSYENGALIPGQDGCNICTCNNGIINCTQNTCQTK